MMQLRLTLGILLCVLAGVTACGDDVETQPSNAGPEQFRLPHELPLASGNPYADDDEAAALGLRLFFEKRLSPAATCPHCHLPELAFTDRQPVSIGKAPGVRNAPTIWNAARLSVFLWDGSVDSLWSQVLTALESPLEMDSTRLEFAHVVGDDPELRAAYEKVFGPWPEGSEEWPRTGKPGQAVFDTLPEARKLEIDTVAANLARAIEAYERRNTTGLSAVDRYLDGDVSALSSVATRGMAVFLAQGCAECHKGPMLTDEDLHDVGFPSLDEAAPAGTAFRTPSLRNVARTPPYGHDGAFATLRDVLAFHAPNLSEEDTGAVIAFLTSLNGELPLPPWGSWPSPQ